MKKETNVEKKELTKRDEILLDELGLMTKNEVAELLQVHTSSIDRYVREGKLPVKKIGTSKQCKCYYKKQDVITLLGLNEKQ
ncbi:MAG: helix-turn-helix domain-containing protein [Bacteroidota bacterium]|jgi:excisionase family DNA binding protein|nr:helix-turn-helix domain-containing protein [Bacteroidia bacterium]